MPLNTWTARFAARDSPGWFAGDWDPAIYPPEPRRWAAAQAKVFAGRFYQASFDLHLEPKLLDPFLFNAKDAISLLVCHDYLSLDEKRTLIECIPDILSQACALDPGSAMVFMFWDGVIEEGDRLGHSSQVHELLYATMVRQLSSETSGCLQSSALHGLNHLKDARAVKVIDRMKGHWASPDVAAYAEVARTFRAV